MSIETKEQIENLNRSCAKEAIDLVKNENSACDVRIAENIIEQVYWNLLPDEMYDHWQEFHGDAKKRYCY